MVGGWLVLVNVCSLLAVYFFTVRWTNRPKSPCMDRFVLCNSFFPFVLSFPILCRSSSFFFSFKLNYWNYSRLSDLIYLQNIKRNALKDWKKRPCRESQFMENVFKIGKLPFIESDKLNRQYNFNWNCQSSANVILSVWIEWWNHQDIEHRLRVSISQIVMVVIAVIWFRLTVYRNQMPSFQTKHRLELPYYKTMSFHTLLL